MAMKLRVLQGKLKRQDGANAGSDLEVHGKRFVIGSAADCHMRCPSRSISEHHCEIAYEASQGERQYVVRDLKSEGGTFVNGDRIEGDRELRHGDILKVGRLEFQVVMDSKIPAKKMQSAKEADPVGDKISEMLSAADREERAQRLEDPTKRRFSVQAHEPPPAEKPVQEPQKKKPTVPAKKPPMKLPPPPKLVTESTVDAAEEVLKKFFERPKK